jgi:hypothetical protein
MQLSRAMSQIVVAYSGLATVAVVLTSGHSTTIHWQRVSVQPSFPNAAMWKLHDHVLGTEVVLPIRP